MKRLRIKRRRKAVIAMPARVSQTSTGRAIRLQLISPRSTPSKKAREIHSRGMAV
jgi:hypothetical protein